MILNEIGDDVLQSLKPQSIRLYLNSRGWIKRKSAITFDIFTKKDSSEEVLVPNDSSYSDYVQRIEDLLLSLSQIENTSPSYILTGLMLSSATDILEYKYIPDSGEAGIIPIDRMISIIEVNKNLTNFAYRDMESYDTSYYSSNWAGKHVNEAVKLGPSIPGSYIIRFIYPGIGSQVQTTLEGAAKLTDMKMRQICDKIESSVKTVIEYAEDGVVYIEPEKKISYNFVASMMNLEFKDADIELKRVATIGRENEASAPISMTNKIFKRISEIEQNMRPPEMDWDSKFVGFLVEAKDYRAERDEFHGSFKLKYIGDNNKTNTAKLILLEDDLEIAYDAMKKRKTVSVKGKLIGSRNNKEIIDIFDFEIL